MFPTVPEKKLLSGTIVSQAQPALGCSNSEIITAWQSEIYAQS